MLKPKSLPPTFMSPTLDPLNDNLWEQSHKFAFWTSSQMMLMLLVWEPDSGKHCIWGSQHGLTWQHLRALKKKKKKKTETRSLAFIEPSLTGTKSFYFPGDLTPFSAVLPRSKSTAKPYSWHSFLSWLKNKWTTVRWLQGVAGDKRPIW